VQAEAVATTHIADILALALVLDPLLQEDIAILVPDRHHPDAVDRVHRGATDLLRREEGILVPLAVLPAALRAIDLPRPRKEKAPRLRVHRGIRARIRRINPAGKNHPRPTLHPILLTLVSHLLLPILAVLLL